MRLLRSPAAAWLRPQTSAAWLRSQAAARPGLSGHLLSTLRTAGLAGAVGAAAVGTSHRRRVVVCEAAEAYPPVGAALAVQKRGKQRRGDDGGGDSDEAERFVSFYWALIRDDVILVLGAMISSAFAAWLNVQAPILYGTLMDQITSKLSGLSNNVSGGIRESALRLLSVYAMQGVVATGYISLLSLFGERFATRLRRMLFERLINQDVEYFDKHQSAELLSRLGDDVQDLKSSTKKVVSTGLRAAAEVVGNMFALYTISPRLTMLSGTLLPTLVIFGKGIGSILRGLSKDAKSATDSAANIAAEAVTNVKTVKSFAAEDYEVQQYEQALDTAKYKHTKLQVGIGMLHGSAISSISMGMLAITVLGSSIGGGVASDALGESFSPGQLISFLESSKRIMSALSQLSMLASAVVKGTAAAGRIYVCARQQPEMINGEGERPDLAQLHGDVVFSGVDFRYPTRLADPVLVEMDLTLKQGTVTALVGQSGCGKSTVARLLERFYDPDSGSVAVDGVDLRLLDPNWLRAEVVGFIDQEPSLFAGSISDNIRYGKQDATNAEVRAAATQASASEFIDSFPAGYETMVGERGSALSGGQKQRIAIARALLKNPKVLILDEATSALDSKSEASVQHALSTLMEGRTVLVIAHRLSTVASADKIVVISNGQVVEQGTHAELLAKGGSYATLVNTQTFGTEDANEQTR